MSSVQAGTSDRLQADPGTEAAPQTAGHRWRHAVALLGLLGLAAGMRLAGITITGVWLDEGHTIWLSRLPVIDILRNAWAIDNHPPLAAICWHFWGLISQDEVWLRLLAVIVGVATVCFAYAWGRTFSPMTGWWAGLLMAVHGLLCHYSQEIRPYPWLYLLTMASLWQVERWRVAPERRRHQIWLGILLGLTAWSQAAGAVASLTVALYAMLRGPQWRRSLRALVPSGLVAVAIALPCLWSVINKGAFQEQDHWWVEFPPHRFLIRYYAETTLGMRWAGDWVGTQVAPVIVWTGYAFERVILVLWALPVAVGLAVPASRKITAVCLLVAAWFLGWMILLSAMAIPMILDRSILPMMIMVLLACAAGGAALMRWRRWAGLVYLLLWVSVQGGWWIWEVYRGPGMRVTPKNVLHKFVDRFQPDDLLLCCPATYELPLFFYIQELVTPTNYLTSDTTPLVWRDGHWQRTARHTDDKDYDWAEYLEAELLARRAAGQTGDLWWLKLGPDGIAPTGHTRRRAERAIAEHYTVAEHYVLWHEFLWRQHVIRWRPKASAPPGGQTTRPSSAPARQ